MKDEIERQVSGKQVLLTLLIWFISSALVGAATFFALRSLAPGWATADNQAITISAEAYFLFLAVAYKVFGGFKGLSSKLNFKFTSVRDIWLAVKLYLMVLGVIVAFYFLLTPFIGPLHNTLLDILRHASDMQRLSSAGFLAWFLIFIRACILVPLTEELLFRGLLYGWARSHFSAFISIFLTALLFMGMHFYPVLFPLGLVFGLTAGWVRERTGSSLNFVLAHIINSILFLTAAYILVTYFQV